MPPTSPFGTSLAEAKAILYLHRIEKLPLVDRQFNLRGLITYKDILKKRDFPNHVAFKIYLSETFGPRFSPAFKRAWKVIPAPS